MLINRQVSHRVLDTGVFFHLMSVSYLGILTPPGDLLFSLFLVFAWEDLTSSLMLYNALVLQIQPGLKLLSQGRIFILGLSAKRRTSISLSDLSSSIASSDFSNFHPKHVFAISRLRIETQDRRVFCSHGGGDFHDELFLDDISVDDMA